MVDNRHSASEAAECSGYSAATYLEHSSSLVHNTDVGTLADSTLCCRLLTSVVDVSSAAAVVVVFHAAAVAVPHAAFVVAVVHTVAVGVAADTVAAVVVTVVLVAVEYAAVVAPNYTAVYSLEVEHFPGHHPCF